MYTSRELLAQLNWQHNAMMWQQDCSRQSDAILQQQGLARGQSTEGLGNGISDIMKNHAQNAPHPGFSRAVLGANVYNLAFDPDPHLGEWKQMFDSTHTSLETELQDSVDEWLKDVNL